MSFLTILIASLLGSPHCAGMCGGFSAMAAHSTKPRYSQLSYHIGRLVTYLSLGLFAGYIGSIVDRFGFMLGINRVAAMITGVILIVTAISMLLGRHSVLTVLVPAKWRNLVARLWALPMRAERTGKFMLGMCSTLLPCGWLYTYVAIAGASGNAGSGALVMFFFWLGTLPLLLTIGSISHLLGASLRRYVPTLVAILMLCAGFFSLSGHLISGHLISGHGHLIIGTPDIKPLFCSP